ncbi:hypothetical protein JCM6882_009223 [Rhodosporidiobolus microsporus]
MSAFREFQSITDKLQSDKIKERSEGVARCRDFLTSKRNFLALSQDRHHSWLETLQLLFHIVILERNAYASKKTGATEKRLDEAASLVRFVAEKVYLTLGKKPAKSLINHLTQMIAIGGKLQPFALTYLKALRAVLSHPPHVEHLDERQWTDVVSLCFAAALGDKIKIGQEFADDVAMDIDSDAEGEIPGALRAGSDDEEDQLDEDALPDPRGTGAAPSSRAGSKRKASSSAGGGAPSTSRGASSTPSASKSAYTPKRTATPTEIELLHLLEVVFRARHSPFLTYALALFRKFLRFFRLFPHETSAHLPALTALNRALAELDLNDQRSMRRLGPHLWTPVVELWPTKNGALKEQVVIALRYLFPFVVPAKAVAAGMGGAGGGEHEAARRAKELYDAVLTEPTIRWREAYELDMDHFRLGHASPSPSSSSSSSSSSNAGGEKAFHAATFRLGAGFDEKHAVAWCTVELGAAALARCWDVGGEGRGEEMMEGVLSPTQRGKRRKTETPLSTLLDSLSDPLTPLSSLVFRLQLLLFVIDRHWSILPPEACHGIFDALVPLLSHNEAQVERWAFLAVAAVAHAGLPELAEDQFDVFAPSASPRKGGRDRSPSSNASGSWDQIFLLSLRKLSSSPEVSRPAAHALNTLLAHALVSSLLLSESIDSFAKDLDLTHGQRGLAFPSDAVCLFLEWALAIAASDARLFRLQMADKVLHWVTTAWHALDGIHRAHNFGQARPHADPLAVDALVRLLARLAAVKEVPNVPHDVVVPDCAVATMEIELGETRRVREFVEGKVPPYVRDEDEERKKKGLRTPAYYDAAGGGSGAAAGGGGKGGADDPAAHVPRKISAWLYKTLSSFAADAAAHGAGADSYWSSMAGDLARRHLDFAALALVVEGLWALDKRATDKRTVREAGEVLTALAPTLGLKKWDPAERALLLGGLSPIFVDVPDSPAIEYPVLLDPSPSSGIPDNLLPRRTATAAASGAVDLDSLELAHLRLVWKDQTTRTALDEVLSALRFILSEATDSPTPPSGTAASSSGFGGMTQGSSATQASQRIKELEQTSMQDDFGEVKIGSRAASVLGGGSSGSGGGAGSGGEGIGGPGSQRAGAATIMTCIRGFISVEMATTGSPTAVRLQEVVDAILSSASGDESILIADAAFSAALAGLVTFGLGQADSLLQHLGGDLLPDYRYARDERFARVALRFLDCTREYWVRAEGPARESGENARTLCAWYVNALRRKIVASWRVRLQFTAFLDKYLLDDPKQEFWDVTENALRTEDNRLITPTAIIPFMLADRDFRVRFRASTSAASLFGFCDALCLSEDQVFGDIRQNLVYNLAESEQILTQILCNANIMIVAGTRRRAPYQLLVKTASESPLYAAVTIASLEGVTARLGFKSLADLYLQYARYFLWLEQRNLAGPPGPDLGQHLSYLACGFPTLRDARKADFNQTASLLLQQDDTLPAFRTMCDVLKRSEQEGRLACLAETISLAIVRFHGEYANEVNPPYAVLQAKVYAYAEGAGAGDQHQQDKLIDSVVDEIFAEILTLTFDQRWPAGINPSFTYDDRAAKTFEALLALPSDLTLNSEPPPPMWPSEVTVRACVWLNKGRQVFVNPAVVFSVVHNLLGKIHRAHFVDEQRRRLVNLAMAAALCYRGVKEHGILATLGDGLIRLLPEPDLVVIVPAMLQWTFRECITLSKKQPSPAYQTILAEQLVRAAHAYGPLHAVAEGEPLIKDIVKNLQRTLRDGVTFLVEVNEPTVAEISLLWPTRNFSFSSVDHVHEALSSSFAPVGKFGIVSALRDHKEYKSLVQRPDRGRILWRLMQAIGPSDVLARKDCFAFADLLFDVEGEVEAPGVEELSLSYNEQPDAVIVEGETGIKKLIVDRLLDHLGDKDALLTGAAFDTAKLVFSVPGADTLFAGDKSSAQSPLAAYLASPSLQRPLRLRHRLPRKLAELETRELGKNARDFSSWVKEVAELLADSRAEGDDFYAQLVPLVQLSPAFAKEVVPYLVHSILVRCFTAGTAEAPEQEQLSSFITAVLKSGSSSDDAIRLVVDTAIYLRKHARPDQEPGYAGRFDEWLNVAWIDLAEGAVKTGAYLAGLLFLELGHEHNGLFSVTENGSAVNRLADERGQALLYDIYSEIDEPDGFYGRESPDVRQALLRRYRHEGQWDGAFRTYGAQHEARSQQDSFATAGVVSSLASFGFNRLAMAVYQPARLEGTLKAQDVAADLPYELAWRTDVWDLPIEQSAVGSSSVSLYTALRACRTARAPDSTRLAVDAAMVDEVKKLSAVTLDLPRPNTEALSTILALREIHRLADIKKGSHLAADLTASLVSVPRSFSFEQAERVLSSRISILRGIRSAERADQVAEVFTSELFSEAGAAERVCLLELSRVARRSGQLQAAFNAVTSAHTLVDNGKDLKVDEELANVLWAQGEHATAITLLSAVHRQSPRKEAGIYARLGEWTAEARMRNAQQVLDESFEPAIRALDRKAAPDERAHVFHSFAVFADIQFGDLDKTLVEKRQRATQYRRRKERETEEIDVMLRSGSFSSGQLERSKQSAKQHLEEDERQVQEAERATRNMLWRSLENYAKALAVSSEYDDKVFRLCALWLAHADNPDYDSIHAQLKPLLDDIPSFKFVFLAYQLSARLTKSAQPTPSAKNVQRLVQRLCIEHPFHALYPVNALRDTPPQKSTRRSSSTRNDFTSKNSRAEAASEIIEKVKKRDSMRERVEAVELALDAYAEWAEVDIKNNPAFKDQRGRLRKVNLPILRGMRIKTKVNNLPIPVTTYDLPVDPDGRYDTATFPTIVRYDDTFDTAGGIHLPKIMICRGSDGRAYKQLLKGDDDIRQDAVMEQVFELVNRLLARDDGGRRRKLRLRTYRVIPLQRMNGLIEFAANTQPLGNFLTGLYDQMAPGIAKKARAKLGEIEGRYKGRGKPEDRDAEKIKTFTEILPKFPPLLRHLFWQKHKVPSLWFDMRLNFSRSVAVSSIVGHIVGLGDRHVSNILMDEARGELVHIDFGIAFDQGKRLPIPELVPFRLTQNLVDGFGMSGVDGVFRRCSEETLRVLRERSSILMTVLEVFKYDPLQNWAVSADMAKRIQGSDEGEALALDDLPDDADRALSIVRSKLDDRLSVQYSVNALIQEATDPANLAVIFSGWQPLF